LFLVLFIRFFLFRFLFLCGKLNWLVSFWAHENIFSRIVADGADLGLCDVVDLTSQLFQFSLLLVLLFLQSAPQQTTSLRLNHSQHSRSYDATLTNMKLVQAREWAVG